MENSIVASEMSMVSKPYLLSIQCMTYNQSAYITDALNGFTMQRTNFPFVAVVVDDASTDGEQEVIKSYIEEHFDHSIGSGYKEWETEDALWTFAQHKENENCHIVVACLKRNLYREQDKKEGVIKDWMNTKYIALCEGDDYWTDPLKLQKQVDFMEAYPDYSLCFTNTIVKHVGFDEVAVNHVWDTYNIEDLIGNNALNAKSRGDNIVSCGHTSTLLYRRPELPLPNWISRCYIGDEPLFIALAQYGKAKFINEQTSVYRALVGVSSKDFKQEVDWQNRIQMYEIINEGLGYKYRKIIDPIIAQWYLKLCKLTWKKKNKKEAIMYFYKSIVVDGKTVMRWITGKIRSH